MPRKPSASVKSAKRTSVKPPALRRHPRGQFFVEFNGTRRYLGTDEAEAQRRYQDELARWSAWKLSKTKPTPKRRGAPAFVEVVRDFKLTRYPQVSVAMRRYYNTHLKRAVNVFGRFNADRIRPGNLDAFKSDLITLKLHPRTIAHDLGAIKTVLAWAALTERIETPIDFRGVKAPPIPPPVRKALTPERVQQILRAGLVGRREGKRHHADPRIVPWMVVQYLACMRPSELPRLAFNEGAFIAPGIYEIKGKTTHRTGENRVLILSEEALQWVELMEPVWKHWEAFTKLVSRCTGAAGSHALRHSAASHLLQRGAAREAVDLLLGHMPSRVSRTYAQVEWQPLRATAATLSVGPELRALYRDSRARFIPPHSRRLTDPRTAARSAAPSAPPPKSTA